MILPKKDMFSKHQNKITPCPPELPLCTEVTTEATSEATSEETTFFSGMKIPYAFGPSKLFWLGTNCFGRVQFVFDLSNLFWLCPNHFGQVQIIKIRTEKWSCLFSKKLLINWN